MKQILLSFLLCQASLSAYAQEYYYNDTKTFVEDGYTYQCDVNKRTALVMLYNKENKFTNVDVINKVTQQPLTRSDVHKKTLVEDMSIPPLFEKIVCSAFTEKQNLEINDFYSSIIFRLG